VILDDGGTHSQFARGAALGFEFVTRPRLRNLNKKDWNSKFVFKLFLKLLGLHIGGLHRSVDMHAVCPNGDVGGRFPGGHSFFNLQLFHGSIPTCCRIPDLGGDLRLKSHGELQKIAAISKSDAFGTAVNGGDFDDQLAEVYTAQYMLEGIENQEMTSYGISKLLEWLPVDEPSVVIRARQEFVVCVVKWVHLHNKPDRAKVLLQLVTDSDSEPSQKIWRLLDENELTRNERRTHRGARFVTPPTQAVYFDAAFCAIDPALYPHTVITLSSPSASRTAVVQAPAGEMDDGQLTREIEAHRAWRDAKNHQARGRIFAVVEILQ